MKIDLRGDQIKVSYEEEPGRCYKCGSDKGIIFYVQEIDKMICLACAESMKRKGF
jgi:hypothetical protein